MSDRNGYTPSVEAKALVSVVGGKLKQFFAETRAEVKAMDKRVKALAQAEDRAPPHVKVVVDMAPVAEALREMGDLFGSLIDVLDRQNQNLEKMVARLDRPAPPKRSLTIRHSDGTESVVEDQADERG